MTELRKVLSAERRKAEALGMFEERNLEGDDEAGLPCGPMEPGAKWPFPKKTSSEPTSHPSDAQAE